MAEEVANYLNNKKRREIAQLEDQGNMTIQVYGKEEAAPEHLVIECLDASRPGNSAFPPVTWHLDQRLKFS